MCLNSIRKALKGVSYKDLHNEVYPKDSKEVREHGDNNLPKLKARAIKERQRENIAFKKHFISKRIK